MLGGSLQENLITMLVYSDEYASIIRNSISINLWSSHYRIVAAKCYDYLDQFRKSPKDHISDLLEDKLMRGDGESEIFTTLLMNMKGINLDGINAEYVFKRLASFIKRQSLRSVAVELTRALQRDTEESLEEAERLIEKAKNNNSNLFDQGTRLDDKKKALKFLDRTNESFPTGIKELDRREFGPIRKELWVAVGDAKIGKSQFLIHLGKMCALSRYKIAHITLEMSESKVSQRYYQTFGAIAKRKENFNLVRFRKDEKGNLFEFKEVLITPKNSLQDSNIKETLENLIDKWSDRYMKNILIKEFPTGTLTVYELEGYLDSLESTEKFVPDLLILDYPDLMKTNKDNYRLSINELYIQLRGLAVRRNIAVAVVSQANRSGSKQKILGSDHIAEAYSKVQHADLVITISATSAERKLGLARLFVTNARNDEGNLQLVISQNYRTSTFSTDSAVISPNYWKLLPTDDEAEDD